MTDDATWDDLIAAGVERALAQGVALDDIEAEFGVLTFLVGVIG